RSGSTPATARGRSRMSEPVCRLLRDPEDALAGEWGNRENDAPWRQTPGVVRFPGPLRFGQDRIARGLSNPECDGEFSGGRLLLSIPFAHRTPEEPTSHGSHPLSPRVPESGHLVD